MTSATPSTRRVPWSAVTPRLETPPNVHNLPANVHIMSTLRPITTLPPQTDAGAGLPAAVPIAILPTHVHGLR